MPNPNGFARFKRILAELGNPEKEFKAIHIAGTNGKGSTSIMTASILETAGYKVGLYTSPHLETECERVQIWDGTHRMIEQDHFNDLMSRAREAGEKILKEDGDSGKLTLFEIYTAAAFMFFEEETPDYIVLECGLGGRLDMTNTLERPLASVITQVGLDHTAELGSTIYKIAHEKAGIIKPGVPVVSQSAELAVKNILKRTAEEKGCRFIDVSQLIDSYRNCEIRMRGTHQIKNAAAAAEAVRASGIPVSEDDIRKGLARAFLPGRFEILSENPYWIIDGAHNPDAIDALTDTFNAFAREHKLKRSLVIFGCMKDKNCARMIQLLTDKLRGVRYAAAAVSYSRAEDPEVIGGRFTERGRSCICYESVEEAYHDAINSNYECVLITGSIYIAGAMRGYFLGEKSKFV